MDRAGPQRHKSSGVAVVRLAVKADLDGVMELAATEGSGLTNLPPDRDLLASRIAASQCAVGPQVLSNLALATILSAIAGLFAAATYAFLKVTRATHDATRAALDEKQRMADAAVA